MRFPMIGNGDMTPNRTDRTTRRDDPEPASTIERRRFLTLGAGAGAALFAGCTTDSGLLNGGPTGTTAGTGDGPAEPTGTFRLLISDQPVAIDQFDELNVSLDRARIFRGEGQEDDDDEETETETPTPTPTPTPTATPNGTTTQTVNATETASPTPTETEEDDDEDEQEGFFVIDLEGATVDLTEVVGEKAIGVFDGELPEGRYSKIELYAADVEGIVDSEQVAVTIPNGKLQIVKPFEVVAGETLSFVFDINVVEKGQTGEYSLLPVISESGVAGKDVDVDEIGSAQGDGDDDDAEASEAEDAETDEGPDAGEDEGSPPDDPGA